MNTNRFIQQIREFIAENKLDAALRQLRALLENSPLLDQVLHQSGRFEAIRRHIRLGTVSHADAALTENQIRAGLLDLMRAATRRRQRCAMKWNTRFPSSTVKMWCRTARSRQVVMSTSAIHTPPKTPIRFTILAKLMKPTFLKANAHASGFVNQYRRLHYL